MKRFITLIGRPQPVIAQRPWVALSAPPDRAAGPAYLMFWTPEGLELRKRKKLPTRPPSSQRRSSGSCSGRVKTGLSITRRR